MKGNLIFLFWILFLSQFSFASEEKEKPQELQKSTIKYKSAKDINFEQLIIQGQLKRPEITVVTGNTDQGTDGLLRLRENFLDHASISIGEETP